MKSKQVTKYKKKNQYFTNEQKTLIMALLLNFVTGIIIALGLGFVLGIIFSRIILL